MSNYWNFKVRNSIGKRSSFAWHGESFAPFAVWIIYIANIFVTKNSVAFVKQTIASQGDFHSSQYCSSIKSPLIKDARKTGSRLIDKFATFSRCCTPKARDRRRNRRGLSFSKKDWWYKTRVQFISRGLRILRCNWAWSRAMVYSSLCNRWLHVATRKILYSSAVLSTEQGQHLLG